MYVSLLIECKCSKVMVQKEVITSPLRRIIQGIRLMMGYSSIAYTPNSQMWHPSQFQFDTKVTGVVLNKLTRQAVRM